MKKNLKFAITLAAMLTMSATVGAQTDKKEAKVKEVVAEKQVEKKGKEAVAEKQAEKGGQVFDVVEVMPNFLGGKFTETVNTPEGPKKVQRNYSSGASGLMSWLADHVKYPAIAEENGIQGTVMCQFVVETDGSISDVSVLRSVEPSLDKEAVRVMEAMPKWAPGTQDGKPVRVKFFVPIKFRLQ